MSNKTPFRYPGSKNKLLETIIPYITPLLDDENYFCDVFVGGGSVALEIAERYPYLDIILNDKDYNIYCFWSIICDNDREELKELLHLIDTVPTISLFQQLRDFDTKDRVMCAYKAIFFNRTTFSGIYSSGPIGGMDQKSKYTVDCRYNVKKIKEKILYINTLLKGRTQIFNEDVNQFLYKFSVPMYLDPPYFEAGDSLYPTSMSASDHFDLFMLLLYRNKWVLSYDNHPKILEWYKDCNITKINHKYCIDGVKTSWKGKEELIITL